MADWSQLTFINWKKGTDGVRTRDLRFTRPTPYHLATAPAVTCWTPSALNPISITMIQFGKYHEIWMVQPISKHHWVKMRNEKKNGSGGIRTHASEETGALNQRLRPLGHATCLPTRVILLLKKKPSITMLFTVTFPSLPYQSLWRNRLARSAVNRKVGGSSPPGSAFCKCYGLWKCRQNNFFRCQQLPCSYISTAIKDGFFLAVLIHSKHGFRGAIG